MLVIPVINRWRSTIEQYLERAPNSAPAPVAVGGFHLSRGQFDEAQRESEKAMLLEPRNVSAALLRGGTAYLRDDFSASEREYVSLLDEAAETDRRVAGRRLGFVYLTQGRFEKAREQCQ